jgi:4-coumarate--CoA ligase
MVYNSPFGDVKDYFYGNIVSFIRDSENVSGDQLDKEIFVNAHDGKVQTAKQLFDVSGRLTRLLQQKYGVSYDDVVCTFTPNHINLTAVIYGILGLGAVVSPANVAYVAKELHHQLNVSGSSVVITVPQLRKTVEEACNHGNLSVRHILYLEDLVEEAHQHQVQLPVELSGELAKTKDAFYCFSSGTSGVPKGVMTTHFNITSNIQQSEMAANHAGLSPGDRVAIGFLPMSHMYGLMRIVLAGPYFGGKCVIMEKFDFELLLKCVVKYNIQTLPVVPPIVVLLAKHPLVDKYPVKGIIQDLSCGAAPLSDSVIEAVTKRLGCDIKQGYGLTETSPVCHVASYDPENYNKDSVGWLAPSVQARIVDLEGNDVPQGERGELWMKGPNIMKGYLKNPEATTEVFTTDGWFKSGDVAIIDQTGQFYIVDRVKELIKIKRISGSSSRARSYSAISSQSVRCRSDWPLFQRGSDRTSKSVRLS